MARVPAFAGIPFRLPAVAGTGLRERGLVPVRGGVYGAFFDKKAPGSSAREGRLVDALALRGDEGRGTLRKARGRCEQSVIPGCPNGATHPPKATWGVSRSEFIGS